MLIESNGETVVGFPCSDLKPFGPYDQGERCLVLAGPHRGERVVTKSADGDDFMVELSNGGGESLLSLSLFSLSSFRSDDDALPSLVLRFGRDRDSTSRTTRTDSCLMQEGGSTKIKEN